MFRSQYSDHHQGSITVLVQLLLIGVHALSYSGVWLYVICASVHTMYLSVWCLVIKQSARICLKRGRGQSKMHIGNTLENDIKEVDPRKAYKYLGIEENFDIQHVCCMFPENREEGA